MQPLRKLLTIFSFLSFVSLTVSTQSDNYSLSQWGNYYKLPPLLPGMKKLFRETYAKYLDSGHARATCSLEEVELIRWPNSSYYTMTTCFFSFLCSKVRARGLEHVKVTMSRKSIIGFSEKRTRFRYSSECVLSK